MKTSIMSAFCVGLGLIVLSGCTTTTKTTTATSYDRTTKKVYTQEELQKRGRSSVGESLSAQDEQITLSGRH